MPPRIVCSVEGGLLVVELPGTPLDADLASAVLDVLPPIDDLDAPHVLLLTAPCGGEWAGLGQAAPGDLPPGLRDGGPTGPVAALCDRVASFAGVSVVALVGDARGCGAELALACDLRIVWSQARLGFPHVAAGRMPACGATQRLPRLAGMGTATRLLLLGEEVDGAAMVDLGLAWRSRPTPEETAAEARVVAAALAAGSATAIRACREAAIEGFDLPLRDGLRLEADLAVLLHTTHDRAEGLRAFLEKRPPRFEGR